MDNKSKVRVGKKLSYVLRHNPQAIGLELDKNGWADVKALLEALAKHHTPITHAELDDIVATNSKKRYQIDETGTRIRASQGHSLPSVDLNLKTLVPPDILYHGTAARFLGSIRATGLDKRNRHHVHLSDNLETATQVGSRHGKVVVLEIDAAAMDADGLVFYRSENGVWLTDNVLPVYIKP